MIFAEEPVQVSHVITGLFMVATAVTTYMSGRDRLKFSAKTQAMEIEIAEQKDTIDRQTQALSKCEKEHQETKLRLEEMNERCAKSERSQSQMMGELQYLKDENVKMREDQKNLRDLLMKRISQ